MRQQCGPLSIVGPLSVAANGWSSPRVAWNRRMGTWTCVVDVLILTKGSSTIPLGGKDQGLGYGVLEEMDIFAARSHLIVVTLCIPSLPPSYMLV
jgi:hypothetical protein